MNEYPSYKSVRDPRPRLQLVTRGESKSEPTATRRSTLEAVLPPQNAADVFWPARELLISLGWPRLFGTIAAPGHVVALRRKEFPRERGLTPLFSNISPVTNANAINKS